MIACTAPRPGDPARAAAALVAAVEADEPPELLLLGSDAVRAVGGVLRAQLAEIEDRAEFSATTDFPAGGG